MSGLVFPRGELARWLEGGEVLSLCARAAAVPVGRAVGYREDGAVLLWGPGGPKPPTSPPEGSARRPPSAPRELHVQGSAEGLRAACPGLWVHADSPLPEADSLCLFTGPAGEDRGEWRSLARLPHPKTAVALHAPGMAPEAILERLEELASVPNLRAMIWLPVQPGDQLFLPGLTTDGTDDSALLAVSRLALPPRIRVRASWAAYGWKLAQVAATFGVEEVAGWGLEEELAWGRGGDPAAVVSREEAEAGLIEAGRAPVEVRGCVWGS